MRYFWSFIALLALLTGGLFTLRVSRESGRITQVSARPIAEPPARPARSAPPPVIDAPAPAADASAPAEPAVPSAEPGDLPPGATHLQAVAALPEPAPETAPEPAGLPEPAETPAAPVLAEAPPQEAPATDPAFSLDALLGLIADAAERAPAPEPAADPEPEPEPRIAAAETAPAGDPMMEAALAATRAASQAASAEAVSAPAAPAPAGPAFEVRPDGSLTIEGVGVIPGAGTPARPFVLDWEVLRSVQRAYNPRQGQAELPAWLNAINGKHVRIEGNTLLPVVSQTTDELLVMQNPWDGCCLGVPPTPYDAIEVKLARAQAMGNSPTGFGQVEGVFKVDPYIVSGWLLGLYMVENAVFESAAGTAMPEI